MINIGKLNFRALVDTGAGTTVIHKRVYDSLSKKPPLQKTKICLESATGTPLNILGYAEIRFKINNIHLIHNCIVVDNLRRNVILGRDFLSANSCRIYFDLNGIKIKDTIVPLQDDRCIASIIRLKRTTILKPQSINQLQGKLKHNPSLDIQTDYQVCEIKSGYVYNEPCLLSTPSIVHVNNNRTVPVLLTNFSNKTIRLKRGCILGQLQSISSYSVESIISNDDEDMCLTNPCPTISSPLNQNDVNASKQHIDLVMNLLNKNQDIFSRSEFDIGKVPGVSVKITTDDCPPIKQRPYRLPFTQHEEMKNKLDQMVEAKIIQPSNSPWGAPVLLVDKKNGSKRLVVDYRRLNEHIIPSSFPLPLIDDLLSMLHGAKYFTTVDLSNGFFHLEIDKQDRAKTAFATFYGLYEYLRLPMGLNCSPPLFFSVVKKAFAGLEGFTFCFLDDVLIYSDCLDSHIRHLQIVFDRIRQNNMKLKLQKCQFLQESTSFLGHIISSQGIRPDFKKVEALMSLKSPQNVREVRAFLGMSGFYRKFIPNYAAISLPLTELTHKNARFVWSAACQQSFDSIINLLAHLPTLFHPDINKPYTLYTDASDYAIGAVLVQSPTGNCEDEVPIHFISHKLSRSQRKYSTILKEAFAIQFALKKLDCYLHGARFTIKTDHKPLTHLLTSNFDNKMLQRYALDISCYDCTIEYIPGKQNQVADVLSRAVGTSSCDDDSDDNKVVHVSVINNTSLNAKQLVDGPNHVTNIEYDIPTQIGTLNMVEEQQKDPDISKLMLKLQTNQVSASESRKFLIKDNILYFISNADDEPVLRTYVPSHLRELVMQGYHDFGHPGISRSYDTIKKHYYWPKLFKDLNTFVGKCVPCQMVNMRAIKAPLKEPEIPKYPFAHISVDIQGPMHPPTLSGNKYLICFVCELTSWPEIFPSPDMSMETILTLFYEHILCRYGAVLRITSDNGTQFGPKFTETMKQLNIDHVKTSTYHPQANGKNERSHATLNSILTKLVLENSTNWDLGLNIALAGMRFNVTESTKHSPYFMVFGRDAILPVDNMLGTHLPYYGDEFHKYMLSRNHQIYRSVFQNIKSSRRRRNKHANKNAKLVDFQINDAVYYKNLHKRSKLQPKWIPYYRVIEKPSDRTLIIKNQLDNQIVRCHVDQVRKANIEDWCVPKTTPPGIRPIRNCRYLNAPHQSDQSATSSCDESDSTEQLAMNRKFNKAKRKLTKMHRNVRDNSSDEDDIPLRQLQMRLRQAANEHLSSSDLDIQTHTDSASTFGQPVQSDVISDHNGSTDGLSQSGVIAAGQSTVIMTQSEGLSGLSDSSMSISLIEPGTQFMARD